jgi:hypothetical protein
VRKHFFFGLCSQDEVTFYGLLMIAYDGYYGAWRIVLKIQENRAKNSILIFFWTEDHTKMSTGHLNEFF